MPKRMTSIRLSEATDEQLDQLSHYGNQSEIIAIAIDRMAREERTMKRYSFDQYDVVWVGAGWYAPRSEGNVITYYFVSNGTATDTPPETYSNGLGTPEWFDVPEL